MTPSARELSSPLWIGRGLEDPGTGLLLSVPLISDDGYYQNMIILSLVFAIGASGLNIITGFAGYVSLGQGASSASAATPSACCDEVPRHPAVGVGAGRGGRRRRGGADSRPGVPAVPRAVV